MRPRWGFVAFLAACGGAATPPAHTPDDSGPHTALADEDRFTPSYGKPELSRALIAERAAEATAEKTLAQLEAGLDGTRDADDRWRIAQADLAVRRRFIASLEACEAGGPRCPPRLDDPPFAYDIEGDQPPPLEVVLHFELAPWRAITAELHARACACRTVGCVDGMTVAIDVLETKPVKDVLGDEAATVSITRARECLFRLRGKTGGTIDARAE